MRPAVDVVLMGDDHLSKGQREKIVNRVVKAWETDPEVLAGPKALPDAAQDLAPSVGHPGAEIEQADSAQLADAYQETRRDRVFQEATEYAVKAGLSKSEIARRFAHVVKCAAKGPPADPQAWRVVLTKEGGPNLTSAPTPRPGSGSGSRCASDTSSRGGRW